MSRPFSTSLMRVDGDVEEVAVVRHQDDRARIGAEELLEPVPRLEVEMVRRLVEQQHVRALEEQAGERDPHLPAAAELADVSLEVRLAKAEPREHRLGAALEIVATAVVPLLAGGGILLHQLRVAVGARVGGFQPVLEIATTKLERVDLVERGQRRDEHGPAARADDLLRQVADGRSLLEANLASVGLDEPGNDAKERRLAGAVGAGQARPVRLRRRTNPRLAARPASRTAWRPRRGRA